jgi:hypothetical protein
MRWTQRCADDVPQSVRSSRVVLAPRCWSQVCGNFCRRWWLTSPAHQEERGAAVTPLRRECRSDFGVPVLACVRLFCCARKAVGAACTRHSLRPLFSEGAAFDASLGRKSRRGNAEAWLPFVVPDERAPCGAKRRQVRARSGTHNHWMILLSEVATPSLRKTRDRGYGSPLARGRQRTLTPTARYPAAAARRGAASSPRSRRRPRHCWRRPRGSPRYHRDDRDS